MKDYLRHLVDEATDPLAARNRVREYLQARMLEGLQDRGLFLSWTFHGGTALRFLYHLPRFSEDLDFSLAAERPAGTLRQAVQHLEARFKAETYSIRVTLSEKRPVHSAFVHFDGLPAVLGISAHPRESLSVKLELDTRPPEGALSEVSVVRRHVLLRVQHHDRATLLAGKLHALLTRPYLKGRDVYDLVWYLSDPLWPSPNLGYLNRALAQTRWSGGDLVENTWRGRVRDRLSGQEWKRVVQDVRPFLERPEDARLLTLENLGKLLGIGESR